MSREVAAFEAKFKEFLASTDGLPGVAGFRFALIEGLLRFVETMLDAASIPNEAERHWETERLAGLAYVTLTGTLAHSLAGDGGAPEVRWRAYVELLVTAAPDPTARHHEAAASTLEAAKVSDADKAQQDRLARELVAELAGFRDAVAMPAPPTPTGEGEPPVLVYEARAADYLAGLGDTGATVAHDLRAAAAKRWQAYLDSGLDEGPLWSWWIPTEAEPLPRFLRALARALWTDRVAPQSKAPKLEPAVVVSGSGDYTLLPKVVSPMSWAMGGGCLEQDGECYGLAPDLARDVAEGVALLPKSHPLLTGLRRPHQASLPLGLGDGGERPLPLAVNEASAGGLLSPLASKLVLYAMADPLVKAGKLVQVTVDELTRTLYPNARRIQLKERDAIVRAVEELGGLHVYSPEALPGALFAPRLFDVAARGARGPDGNPEPEGLVYLAFSRAFTAAWPGFTGGAYAGEFLINLTGAMGLDNRQPALLRHYVRACAVLDASFLPGSDGRFYEPAQPVNTPADWGAKVNALSPSVVEYLLSDRATRARAGVTARAETSKAQKRVMDELTYLDEECGLIRVKRTGKGRFKVLPPEGYTEAWAQIRKAGRRPRG